MPRSAAACLDIALTKRGEDDGEPIPMCGVPVHAAEAYLARLITAGHRVAIAEQIESPAEARKARGSKALVDRAIVRLVTAGTLTEETLLDSRAANWLAAVGRAGERLGIAAADISTGRFELVACGPGALDAELARLGAGRDHRRRDRARASPRPRGKGGFDSLAGERALKERFGVATLDGFGSSDRAELAAAGGLLAYLDATAEGRRRLPRRAAARSRAASTWRSTRRRATAWSSAGRPQGGVAGSLLAAIDRCVTGAGARLLAADLSAPLTDTARDRGAARPGRTGFTTTRCARERMRAALHALPDIGRALGRLVAGRGSPRDLGQLRDGLGEAAARCTTELAGEPRPAARCSPRCCRALGGHGALIDRLARALVPSPPIDAAQGRLHRRRL